MVEPESPKFVNIRELAESIDKKLDAIGDLLLVLNANLVIMRSRINAVELGQVDLAKSMGEIGALVRKNAPVLTHQDYGD